MVLHADLGRLAEIAGAAPALAVYEREVLAPRVGFDVAMFNRAVGVGAFTPGLDPALERACGPYWAEFGAETKPVAYAAMERGGVALDLDVLGRSRMERRSGLGARGRCRHAQGIRQAAATA